MERLNYHHLLYFWTVAREGTVARAAAQLRLAQPTVTGQVRALEVALGEKLFERHGRRLRLTEVGQVVYRYAEEIFSLGRELSDTLKGRPMGRPRRLAVGVADVLPKLIAHRLIEPALRLPEPVRLVVREDSSPQLIAALALHELDLVLTDAPVGSELRVKAFSHLLGESAVALYAAPRLAARLRGGFPRSLQGAPFLLPAESTTLRRALDVWLETHHLTPRVVGELDDSALIKVFGQHGDGVFAAPSVIERDMRRQFGVVRLGRLEGVDERFYAISIERRIQHPAALAISETARRELFPRHRGRR